MNRENGSFDYRTDASVTDESANRTDGGSGRELPLSRRGFLRATGAAGVAGLGLGMTGSAAAVEPKETCDEPYGKIDVGDWTVMDNQWGMSGAQQCVWRNQDGSYGYDFDASNTSGGINYPETFCGTRPWGDDTGTQDFPIQRRNVDELTMDVEADVNVSGGEWDWAEEWWLMEQPPGQQTKTHKYEIMLLLDWGGGHDHGRVRDPSAWTDQYGNTVDFWRSYSSSGTSAPHYIFRIQGRHDGGKIDMKEIVDYLSNNEGIRGDLWLSGIELGNEYWGGASGQTTYNKCNVTVNGTTYTSGSSSGGGADTTTPSRPSNLRVTGTNTSSVSLAWNAASDSGGSGLSSYEVSVGSRTTTVSSGTTQATITGLSAGTSYDVSVVAVDGAGNRSSGATATATTDTSGPTVEPIEGTTPQNIDGDQVYEDLNANGNVDFDDVVVFSNHRTDPVMTDHTAAYDYNGNDDLDFDDIVTLFGETQ